MKYFRQWFFLQLLCFLIGSLVDSFSLSSATSPLSVTFKVGNQAVLPCSWKQRLGEEAPSTCYIQWNSPADTIFELQGEKKWQAEEFQGRVEVPEEKLKSGDCSLVISDVQIGDTGRYESFMLVDGARSTKTKVFIQSVKLSVSDYKSILFRGPGEDLVLDLYTQHSGKVVFQDRNSSEWSVVWMRGEEDSERMEQDVANERLTIKNLKSSDEGMYKVMDEQGLAVSTVLLSVIEGSKAVKLAQTMEHQVPTGGAVRGSCSALLLLSVLITEMLHLF
ncbi:galectin 17 [Pseudochaenichthys georgianus]|uniref:galectin 17 n=1 Tax=Pseudochaenichthys georgianus TaxID=52239 RepID=UPI00146E9455|nr:coxsackievirus and adenovirus receptor isoform X1 [Pseudochaenichthys georgianus]